MATNAQNLHLIVISDIHVMCPQLLINDGVAFEYYLSQDRKMLKESAAILQKLTQNIICAKPDAVLISGDLTKDGELLSHIYLKENCLNKLKDAGIQVLVTPGNHDINNPNALSYDGDSVSQVESITAADFKEIYQPFGFSDAIAQDSASLSYVYQLSPSVRVLSIDANLYELNDFEKRICRHEGRIKPETMAFIEKQMRDAKEQNIRVIGMMHHGLIEHWSFQDRTMNGYLVDNWRRTAKKLRRLGLKVIFTGHSHAQDIAKLGDLHDVETGSPVSHPSPYREVFVSDSQMDIRTNYIDNIDYDLGGESLLDYSRRYTAEGFKFIIRDILPKDFPENLRDKVLDSIAESFTLNYIGNEYLTKEKLQEVDNLARQMRSYSFLWSLAYKKISKSLLNDVEPNDNNLTLNF